MKYCFEKSTTRSLTKKTDYSQSNPFTLRKQVIADCKRVVIKVGSRLLSKHPGVSKEERIFYWIEQCQKIREQGKDVIVVTSGAISAGMEVLGIQKRPKAIPKLQSLAAVGQSHLMAFYQKACQKHGLCCAQILLSYDDLRDRKRHLHLCNCLNTLLSQGIIPIVNENDVVSIDEISFGDNDKLAALLAAMTHSGLTILLTTVDGLLDMHHPQKKRISLVQAMNPYLNKIASGTDGNAWSVGGMISKLQAAETCMTAGEALWIANGQTANIIENILEGKNVGTLFFSGTTRLSSSKRFLAFFTESRGEIIIDPGATHALINNKKSLLPVGICRIIGRFEKGDTVHIIDQQATNIGRGISNYDASELNLIKGLSSSQIVDKNAAYMYEEVIHRDNMVITYH